MPRASPPALPRHVALLQSPALGDSLLLMTVAYNLRRNGVGVQIFGSHTWALHDWFPDLSVHPALPDEMPLAQRRERLAGFDLVLQLHADRPFADLASLHPHARNLAHLCGARRAEAMVDRLLDYCRDELGLHDLARDNGLRAPAGLVAGRHQRRVALHPTASTPDKCWLAARYIRLARRLSAKGFEPALLLCESEREAWRRAASGIEIPAFASIAALAAFVYESAWFIGNDSGLGHLASNLGVPTLSLFMRRGTARTWRPAWGPGSVLVGGAWLPGSWLKERAWKHVLGVRQVLRAFERLRSENPGRARRR